jgi:hypothetical protein
MLLLGTSIFGLMLPRLLPLLQALRLLLTLLLQHLLLDLLLPWHHKAAQLPLIACSTHADIHG